MIIDEEDYLAHYGTKRHSGRYPWGSGSDGDEPIAQRNKAFLDHVAGLRAKGMSETDIARGLGVTTTQLRAMKSIAKNAQHQSDIDMAQRLHEKGLSNVKIGQRMGINESSVRALLAPGQKDKTDILQTTASMLRDQVAKKKYVDVGSGVENHLGISQTKLATAVAVLRQEGYQIHYVPIEQLGTGKNTTHKVLVAPGTEYSETYKNRGQIKLPTEFSDDGGRSFSGVKPPVSISSSRVAIRYAEEGGSKADGVIYLRPGKEDLSLGHSRYAQVRIAVDGTHYLKGMAMYKDDLPDGVDILFNTNKSDTGNKLDAMKELKKDKDGKVDESNPFGATIKPGGQRGVLNVINEEGDWDTWSRTLSSQMLSKQKPSLARDQLHVTLEEKRADLDEITKLTNPSVRRKLLELYAEDADSSAVRLKAAALPRQGTHIILPIESIKPNEIYAPTFRNGERVVLVRHPHGGIFEIPELVVNNRNSEARKALGDAEDAVGIHHSVAQKLSGADFDGDHVLVIPNNSGRVKTAPTLEGLKDFDPRSAYPGYEGMPKMTARTKGIEMGNVSNLITDMTIRGASNAELARAIRHSMVVIDAEKHDLDWRESARVNGISQLKEKYQGGKRAGASTLISRATAEKRVPERKQGFRVDPVTGRKIYTETGATYVNNRGKTVPKTMKSKRLAETDDANTLSSGTPIEKVYATHSNALKELANRARLEAINTRPIPYSPTAKKVYASEVSSLEAKLNLALRNRPLERQAQLIANTVVSAKRQANPDMDAAELKKVKSLALVEARNRTGAKKELIEIGDKEWEAIQAGAISNNKLMQILNNADTDRVRQLATPRVNRLMTPTKLSRARAMLNSNYTQAEVADALGVSVSTLKKSLSEGGGS